MMQSEAFDVQQCEQSTWDKRWFTILLAVIVIAGCSDGRPERVPVSGTVLINGQPLTSGNIKFVPSNGRPSGSKIDEQGHFNLTCYDGNDGALLGKHQVQVSSNRIISDSKIEWYAPKKYADFRTSGIEIEVTEPIEGLEVELSWGDKKGPYID
ncbi:hypothetical protein [Bythopirellula goksoeyrii]|uniref:Carboxypeptidase regulatory-like domain-containing protein n=1 Tax=Bythopirellula goksoeyrii TaxID=1400387 RepID=A0A5B9QQR0_9BACT|nr:hypothetical protein [Bythopirellula goksoeyrii]QEG36461.1 hypothetical protein Pr1d_37750 [Bythopirellula goksoeyrii]